MSLPREPFAWDQGDDLPVPLEDSNLEVPVTAQILSDAERVVLDAQADIARQDTDPTVTIPTVTSDDPAPATPLINFRVARSLSHRGLAISLAFGCALAFLHGWSVGASAAGPRSQSCVSHHCQTDPSK